MTKKDFVKKVTILIDSREKENQHIKDALDQLGIKYEVRKLDFADYSFMIDGRDFSQTCVIERKANVDEFYGNIMHDRERIEKELLAISRLAVQCTLIIENCASYTKLKQAKVSARDMEKQNRKVQNIGEHCYCTLLSWESANRYGFKTAFIKDKADTTGKILETFYYYYHNYHDLVKSRRNYK